MTQLPCSHSEMVSHVALVSSQREPCQPSSQKQLGTPSGATAQEPCCPQLIVSQLGSGGQEAMASSQRGPVKPLEQRQVGTPSNIAQPAPLRQGEMVSQVGAGGGAGPVTSSSSEPLDVQSLQTYGISVSQFRSFQLAPPRHISVQSSFPVPSQWGLPLSQSLGSPSAQFV